MTVIGPYEFSATDVRSTLAHAIDLLDQFPRAVRPAQTARRGRIVAALDGVDPMRGDPDTLAGVLAVVWPELLSARDDLVASDLLPQSARGHVSRLSVSDGGLPKLHADRIRVDFGGIVGDRQATRAHHGRPWQALCLWSTEAIAALVADGHHIGPGSAGENITIGGLTWGDVFPGVRLRVGTALCEISAYAVPCRQNARWFKDGDFNRIHHSNGPVSRVYATVIEPGIVEVGDDALLEPGLIPQTAWTDEHIETDRLRLRPFRDDDKPTIIALASSPDVRRFLGGPVSDDQLDAIRHATVGERWGSFCAADLATDAAIGSVSFGREHGELEISYGLLPERWGLGLATEAVAAALDWAWANTDEPAIIAVTQTLNSRSLRLLGRLGFVPDGEFEEFGAAQSRLRLVRPAADPV